MGYTSPATSAAVTFADNGAIGSWAASAVQQMQMAGILTGTATRGELAAMLDKVE